MTTALIIVDVQHDFLPGGSLAVPSGDAVIPVINRLIPIAGTVFATRDWHPADHVSFAETHPGRVPGDTITLDDGTPQILWPVHCVQNTHGGQLHPDLALPANAMIVDKGTDPTVDSYSGFFDNGRRAATGLAERVAAVAPDRVLIAGLATDYCVRATVIDACELGLPVTVVTDGCRAVDLAEGDGAQAIDAMRAAGADIRTASEVLTA
ncbi:MAG: bifunctional nicotinamidase/pyrazinamidase [Phycisphaerales bacterium]